MNPNLATQVLRYVQVSSTLGKKALDALGIKQAAEKRAAEKVSALVAQMLQTGVIAEAQKQAAEQMLGDHAATMDLLKNAVEKIAALKAAQLSKKAGDLGHADPTASDDVGSPSDPQSSLTSPFVGARTSEKKASDVAMFKRLGLPV